MYIYPSPELQGTSTFIEFSVVLNLSSYRSYESLIESQYKTDKDLSPTTDSIINLPIKSWSAN